jgi:hypothetical protein
MSIQTVFAATITTNIIGNLGTTIKNCGATNFVDSRFSDRSSKIMDIYIISSTRFRVDLKTGNIDKVNFTRSFNDLIGFRLASSIYFA